VMSATFLADAAGSLVGGLVTDAVGPRATFAVGASVVLVVAWVAVRRGAPDEEGDDGGESREKTPTAGRGHGDQD
jgi:predicted MFS family arabinose efflux permease